MHVVDLESLRAGPAQLTAGAFPDVCVAGRDDGEALRLG
jgi:hypothetical protein